MKWNTRQMAGRAASVATIWGVSKLLASPAGQRATDKIDRKLGRAQKKTAVTVRRGVRNARDNRMWAAAGIASLAIAAVLLTTAVRRD